MNYSFVVTVQNHIHNICDFWAYTFVPSLIVLGVILEESLQEGFWQNRGSSKYYVDLSCMANFVFQPD